MAKRDPHVEYRIAVERQSGAVRALSIAIADEAATRTSDRERRTRELMEGWSAQLAAIANAITDAAFDPTELSWWSHLAKHLAIPLAALGGLGVGASEGVGQAAFEFVVGDAPAVASCAANVVEGDRALVIAIERYDEVVFREAKLRHPQRRALQAELSRLIEVTGGDDDFARAAGTILRREVTVDEVHEWVTDPAALDGEDVAEVLDFMISDDPTSTI